MWKMKNEKKIKKSTIQFILKIMKNNISFYKQKASLN